MIMDVLNTPTLGERLIRDTIRGSKISNSRKSSIDGNRSLNEARKLLRGMQDIDLPSSYLDMSSKALVFGNIFSSIDRNARLNRTQNVISSNQTKIGVQIQSINSRINHLESTLLSKKKKLADLRKKLLKQTLNLLE